MLSKKTSFFAAFKYAVVPLVLPSFEAVAKPSISPSEIKSIKVANCLLCKLSLAIVGGSPPPPPPPPLPPPPDPIMYLFLSVMPVPQLCLHLHL